MRLARFLTHLFTSQAIVRRRLGPSFANDIEAAVRAAEATHGGEILVVVEPALEPIEVLRGKSGRERALEVFSEQRVWDTEHNNGVLLYVLFADHDIEILADRGLASRVPNGVWESICAKIEEQFSAGKFTEGLQDGVRAVSDLLREHFPVKAGEKRAEQNELSNAPIV
jgi:uncharacterized membrane protein